MAASSSWVSTRSKNQELDSPHKRIKDFKSIRKNLEKLGQNLTVLNLAHNAIFEIPDYLTVLCPNLKRLNLANNKIKVVPSHLGSLKKLEHLNLAFNEIKILPVTFGNLICLTHLDLSRNLLTDDSLMNPPKIFDLRTIERLYLSDNFLEKIGPEFGTFGNLKILALRYFTQYLKITEKVSCNFDLKLAVKQCYQICEFKRTNIGGKCKIQMRHIG